MPWLPENCDILEVDEFEPPSYWRLYYVLDTLERGKKVFEPSCHCVNSRSSWWIAEACLPSSIFTTRSANSQYSRQLWRIFYHVLWDLCIWSSSVMNMNSGWLPHWTFCNKQLKVMFRFLLLWRRLVVLTFSGLILVHSLQTCCLLPTFHSHRLSICHGIGTGESGIHLASLSRRRGSLCIYIGDVYPICFNRSIMLKYSSQQLVYLSGMDMESSQSFASSSTVFWVGDIFSVATASITLKGNYSFAEVCASVLLIM